MKLWIVLLASKSREIHVFAEICMPHAMQIRQTGGPEVLNWTAADVGERDAADAHKALEAPATSGSTIVTI
ncbi:MAG: hypothetical protein JO232_03460 [Verrucomicrobia bacterium]|nr:hypothetical protein [Verrucomicrobiota bacterium]